MSKRAQYYCIVCSKNNTSDSDNLLRMFSSFPKSPEMLEKWITILNLKGTKITKRAKVCDLHFSKSQFVRTRLRRGAVPSLTPRGVKSVTGIGSSSSVSSGNSRSSNKPIKPAQKNLVPVLLLTPATPVSVFQVAPTSTQTTASSLPLIPPPQVVQEQSDTLKDNPTRTTDTFASIPESLKQFLHESLKKEVADKVLKDAHSVKSFCRKIMAEMENWDKTDKSQIEQDGDGDGEGRRKQTRIIKVIVEKEEPTEMLNENEDEYPLPLSVYPTVSVKVEDDGYHPNEVEPEDDDSNHSGDPLGDDENDEDEDDQEQSVRMGQEFMEWHDESVEES
ncbi:unnamed protein product [Orchesella dallaii]|uniref:THAP-type domain-containing protein n=1 Tax=Orchesella dallaii TaxID=48710 RepID=A0ABP1R5K3_9HEXA